MPTILSEYIDLEKIEIHKRRWTPLTPYNITVTRGYRIYFPGDPGPAENLSHLAHLIHETVHVWQYEYWGVGLYSPRWLNRKYHYRLLETDRLLTFGLEQQAALIEDWFRKSRGLSYRWAENDPPLSRLEAIIQACEAEMQQRFS